VPEPDEDPEMAELDRKREELKKAHPDIGPLIAQAPGGDDEPESQVGTVFGSGS
jgi:hypothetical protein